MAFNKILRLFSDKSCLAVFSQRRRFVFDRRYFIYVKKNGKIRPCANIARQVACILVKLPFRDLRPLVTSYVTGLWRSDWENDSTNKLQQIGASVDSLRPMMKSRREETVLTRIRISHSHLTHAHLLRGDPRPVCEYCRRPLSIRQLLIT